MSTQDGTADVPVVADMETGPGSAVDGGVSGDPLLNLLIHLSENAVRAPITLFSSGLVFTGTLISRKEYFELSRVGAGAGALAPIFQAVLDQPGLDPDEDRPAPDYKFVHLSGGQVIAPGTCGMPQEGTLLRIDRSEIIGWHLGSLKGSE